VVKLSLTAWGLELDWFVPIAQACERAGYEALWISDHLFTPLEYRRVYPYNDSGEPGYTIDTPLHDIWPMLAAIAVSTKTIQVGSGVVILPIRNPIITAHAAVTIQNLSHGRFLFGIGTGWMAEEFEAVGEPFEARGARTEEILDVMEKVWTGKPTSHQGRFYSFPPATHPPVPVAPMALLGCGLSKGMMERTARRTKGWYGPAISLEASLEAVAELERMRARFGQQQERFDSYVRLHGPYDDANLERHRAAGVEHLVISQQLLGLPAEAVLERRLEAIEAAAERFARVAV
jgi:probable F420-dependent oxidoreductase